MLLSKALRIQQDLEDKKNEIIIEGLENKIKDYEASLEEKTSCFRQWRVHLHKFRPKMLN
jgi:hypothetical protein